MESQSVWTIFLLNGEKNVVIDEISPFLSPIWNCPHFFLTCLSGGFFVCFAISTLIPFNPRADKIVFY